MTLPHAILATASLLIISYVSFRWGWEVGHQDGHDHEDSYGRPEE